MQDQVFFDPRVTPTLRNVICVHIDVDKDQDDAEAYGVSGIPRMIVLDPDLNKHMDITGGMEAGPFAEKLRYAVADGGGGSTLNRP